MFTIAERSLASSVIARALTLGVSRPTDSATGTLFSEDGRKALVDAAFVLDGAAPGPVFEAAQALAALPAPRLDETKEEFALLFGHTLRGRVCPYETEYGPDAPFRQSHDLADIGAYYGAFGLTPVRTERIDHIAFELDFLEFLSMKVAYAAERRDQETRVVTEDATRGFLRDHLGRFGVSFGSALERQAGGASLYALLGKLVSTFLTAECRFRRLEVGPELLPLSSPGEDDVPMACGGDTDLVQITE